VVFDILPTDDWYPIWFDLPSTKPFSLEFERFDYGRTTFIESSGSMWIFGMVIVLKYPLFWFVKNTKFQFCGRIEKSMRDELFWASPIDFMITGYIEFVFAALVNYQRMAWVGWGIWVSNFSLMAVQILMLAFPIALWILQMKTIEM
jgi:hypothetical protein